MTILQNPEATTAARTTIQALVNGEEPSLLPPEPTAIGHP